MKGEEIGAQKAVKKVQATKPALESTGCRTSSPVLSETKKPNHRPRAYNRAEILEQLKTFIEENPFPLIEKFCTQASIPQSTITEWPEIRETIEQAKIKSRVHLIESGLTKDVDVTMAIFVLKNLGMTDKQTIELTTPAPVKVEWIEPQDADR